MLDDRKTAILRAVVREYIETAQPVGSGHVARAPGVNVSSATIRNEMAVLEQEGYLAQPHTSAGRVPTDKGYRFYVDHLTERGRLDDGRASEVRQFFASTHGAIEQMLRDTSRLLSDLTSYAAIVTSPHATRATVRSVQLVALSARQAVVVIVLSNGAVENRQLEWDDDASDVAVAAAGTHLAAGLVGTSLPPEGKAAPSGDDTVDRLCAQVHRRLSGDSGDDDVYVGGVATMTRAFEAVEVVRSILHTLEQQYIVVSLVRDILDRGLSVAIGAEHGVEPLAACSLVVAPYFVEGEPVGTVGVLGPTRMDYPRALAAVDVVSERLGRRLSDR
jgi:heat-inducible transcriptional repressor